MARVTPNFITTLQPNEIFVFGSNLAGMHGGGAAHVAHKLFGAQWGVGVGPTGQCYAIPTMQGGVETIKPYVDEFIAYARQHTELTFLVTRIGCGIAGFTDKEIAPLFAETHDLTNVVLPHGWREMRKQVEVVAAVIFDEQGRIFATQRGYGEWKDWWEFPGGKMEAGETPQEALRREIREELDAEIEVGELMKTIDYDYPNFHLTMHCFKCGLTGGLTLKEHEAAKWLAPDELDSVKWLPADEGIIDELKDPIRIVFDEAERQSAAYDGEKMIGECQYDVDRTGKWLIVHTGVRPEYNGKGIAKRLVECIIDAARAKQVKIIPVCSYAQRMMSGKDEYQDVL